MSKDNTTARFSSGDQGNVSVKRTPLTNKIILDEEHSFEMVAGNGYAMPIFRKKDK